MPRDYAPQLRCLVCGCPNGDHVPIRYTVRVWLLHLLPAWLLRTLRPLRRR